MVRLKSRYLLCEVVVQEQRKLLRLNDYVIVTAVRGAVCQAHGDYGAAACQLGFTVKYLNAHTGIVLLRCRKSHYRLIWSALPFITSLENKGHKVPCFLNCLHVGGTIRTCQKFLVRYSTQQLHRMLPKCQSQEEQLEIRRAILSCSLVKEKDEAFDDEGGSGEEDEGNSQI